MMREKREKDIACLKSVDCSMVGAQIGYVVLFNEYITRGDA
jgi:hypothetical protein